MKPNARRRAAAGAGDAEAQRHWQNGMALEMAGRLREATEAYRRVTVLQPRNTVALSRYGHLLRATGDLAQSLKVLERAVRLDPKNAETHVFLGGLYRQLREDRKALASYERAAWLSPNDTRALGGKASIHEQSNELDKAAEALELALAANPLDGYSRIMRARLYRRQGELARGRAILEQMLRERLTEESRFRAGFELGRTLEKMGEFEATFEAISTANQRQADSALSKAVDTSEWLRLLDDLGSLTSEHFERWAATSPPDPDPPPVFLVGFPRSGTTMTEQILSAHPSVSVTDERDLISPMYEPLDLRYERGDSIVEMLDKATEEGIIGARRVYRELAGKFLKARPGATLLIDKNPMNIALLGVINRVFPNARVIHAYRDPRDVCLSCYFQEFVPNHANVFFFSLEGTLEMYRRVMDLWLAQRERLTLDIYECRYEKTTTEFEAQARGLIEFAGLEWDERVLRFHETSERRYVSTPSYDAVRSPVHTKAQGKWRRYEEQLTPILGGLEPYVRALGYEG